MPVASEGLPRTWRPLGVRLAIVFFGGLLLLLCVVLWLAFPPEIQAKFTLFQRATLVFVGLLAGSVGWALARSRVVAETDRIVVVNGFRRREYEWAEVIAIRMPAGAPWATLDLSDGTSASAMALQSTDGDRAQRAVQDIRSLLDE